MEKLMLLACLSISGLLYAGNTGQQFQNTLDPNNTYVFVAGVLKWQSPSLAPFSNKNRKDEEFYNLLLNKGIKNENTVFLKDNDATLDNMNNSLKDILQKANAQSTFIFYYAGHGVRAGNGPVCFANYDYKPGNGFEASTVSAYIKSSFKGKQVWLLADCCYSGTLMEEAKKISTTGKPVVTFTSSSSANISTANWTFTQTIIDCLSGLTVGDRNADGKISLAEVKSELFDAMKYREKQLSGTVFYNVDEATPFNMVPVKTSTGIMKTEYIYIPQNNKFEPARVMVYNGNNVTGELYHYSDKATVTVPVAKTKSIAFAEYPVGMKVQVEWNGKNYPAEIKETRNGFHYIHYTGYDDSWNEWVMYNRIYTSDRKKCTIEWQGNWYPGELLQQKDAKYFIHYTGFGNDWDEWVGKERVKL
jgi:Caspase domain/RNA binding activity-knot of a chromodomain